MNSPSLLRAWTASLFCAIALGGATAAEMGNEAVPSPPPDASPAAAAVAPEPSPAPSAVVPPVSPDRAPGSPAVPPVPAGGGEGAPSLKPRPNTSIEIDLRKQRAYLLRDGQKIAESPISSGRAGHLTPTGRFSVLEKDVDHYSSLYGSIVSSSGRTVKSGADMDTPVPKGCHFRRAPMRYFLRFDGAVGTHAGILPGYAASHGCVRMPLSKAQLFYETVELGSPVYVFGSIPERASARSVRKVATPVAQPLRQATPPPVPPAAPPRRWFPFWSR
jgi:lipoprotein-anchoring transpeptidase ErfK/SrfK